MCVGGDKIIHAWAAACLPLFEELLHGEDKESPLFLGDQERLKFLKEWLAEDQKHHNIEKYTLYLFAMVLFREVREFVLSKKHEVPLPEHLHRWATYDVPLYADEWFTGEYSDLTPLCFVTMALRAYTAKPIPPS